MDMNNPSEPRMPRVEDLKLLDLMGVISSLCTTRSIPTSSLGYRSPREFRKQPVEGTTENAVGAVRRPLDSTMSADAIGSSPPAARSAETRSVRLDASAAVDPSGRKN